MKTLAAAASILALSTAPALAGIAPPAAPPPATATAPTAAPTFYQFDVAITGIDEGSKATAATYSLIVEENQRGSLHSGWNIPYTSAPNTTMREALGLQIGLDYQMRGATIVLDGDIEIKGVDPTTPASNPTWRQVSAKTTIPMVAGTPTMLTSMYDIASKRRYEVTVTAKRIM